MLERKYRKYFDMQRNAKYGKNIKKALIALIKCEKPWNSKGFYFEKLSTNSIKIYRYGYL